MLCAKHKRAFLVYFSMKNFIYVTGFRWQSDDYWFISSKNFIDSASVNQIIPVLRASYFCFFSVSFASTFNNYVNRMTFIHYLWCPKTCFPGKYQVFFWWTWSLIRRCPSSLLLWVALRAKAKIITKVAMHKTLHKKSNDDSIRDSWSY